jgi:hypothetical protein
MNHPKVLPTSSHPYRRLAAIALAAVVLSGCGISDPYARRADSASTTAPTSTSATPANPQAGDPVPERNGTIPPAVQSAQNKLASNAGLHIEQAALARYALIEINWTSRDIGQVQRELASISLGQARAQALQAAASDGRDSILQHSHVANSGTIVSIAPGQGAARGRWVLVTAERTTGAGAYAGLPAALHVTYATLTRARSGWIVESWQPQN